MKMQRHLLCVAPLAVCALLLLSACGGPTPIAGRVTETAMPTVRPDTPASPTIGVPSTKPPESTGSPTADVSPSPAATATDAPLTPPPDTPTPTETPTEAPTATPTPEALTAPNIEGLSLKPDGKGGMQYVAEKNPYGVSVGEVVGSVGTYLFRDSKRNLIPRTAVVIRNQAVLQYLTNQANLKEADKTKWKIALPVTIGPGTIIEERNVGGLNYLLFDKLPDANKVGSPFTQGVDAIYYNNRVQSIAIIFPTQIGPTGFSLNYIYLKGTSLVGLTNGTARKIEPLSSVVKNISGRLPPIWGSGSLVIAAATTNSKNFDFENNVISIGGIYVFADT